MLLNIIINFIFVSKAWVIFVLMIKVCCFVFQVGTAAEIRQPASGMSHDWAKARAGIKFSYHVDLRDSFGPYGFLLPGSQIVSTARETWQAVKAIVDNLSVA